MNIANYNNRPSLIKFYHGFQWKISSDANYNYQKQLIIYQQYISTLKRL